MTLFSQIVLDIRWLFTHNYASVIYVNNNQNDKENINHNENYTGSYQLPHNVLVRGLFAMVTSGIERKSF